MVPKSGVLEARRRDNRLKGMTTYNRVWFITESSAGLGRALAEAVLARGERAVLTARIPERLRDVIERYPAQALVLELDVAREEQVRRAVGQAKDRFGRIDVLVNNAGAAIEGLVAALAQEKAPLGITVTVLEPVGFRTDSGNPGDAADAIIAAVDRDAPPRRPVRRR
jgi:NAD(P)-dependent dehydrogenase (short-subunit alcohol dehydrogenase family)